MSGKIEFGVKHRLLALSIFGLLMTTTVCLIGMKGQSHLVSGLHNNETAATALRNHMEADMMHDALRGDVLNALHSAATHDSGAYAEASKDLKEHVENFRSRITENEKLALDPAVSKAIQDVKPALAKYQTSAEAIVQIALSDPANAERQFPEFLETFGVLEDAMGKLSDLINARSQASAGLADKIADQSRNIMIAVLIGSGLAVLGLSWLLGRGIIIPLRQLYEAIDAMRTGAGSNRSLPQFKAEFKMVGDAVDDVIRKIEAARQEEMRLAAENQRVRNALDNVSSNVMIADNNGQLVYLNSAVREMLRAAQGDIRKVISEFDVENLDGANIDIFHRDPSHQRRMLENLKATYRGRIQVGGRTFDLVANPVVDGQGKRLGTVVEWADKTVQMDAEEQVKDLIANASRGNLDSRLNSTRSDGFMRQLMEGINTLLDSIVGPLSVAAQNIERIAAGDIPNVIAGDYQGAFATLVNNVNTCSAAVRALVNDMNSLSAAATAGRLHERAELQRHNGDFRRIVAGVNSTLDAIVGPLTVAAENIACIARGEIPEAVRNDYAGAFATLINNVNTCCAAVRALVADTSMLAQAAVGGQLSTRADSNHHHGDFRRIIDDVNAALDAISLPVNETKEVMAALAQGELGQRVLGQCSGDFAVLRDAVNTCTDNLRKMVTQIRETSSTIGTTSDEIAQGNQDLSHRTEQQASSLEETASTMEELTGTVKQNATNAKQANDLAANAREVAERGGAVVGNAIVAMGDIHSSSKRINEIISVIDEIAFQTNLLALNAAVEAARAGEQGRGFAVVASEVRNLAQRSAGAAKEIKDLIKDSGEKVNEGARLVNETGTALHAIVKSVNDVSIIIAEIASASSEQANGIEQVNRAVTEMDKAVQQNAALVEQAAAASETMQEHGQTLLSLMSFFKNNNTSQILNDGNEEQRELRLASGT
ncbi:MAG: methyl-accepting chemotaxis protein [Gammaproteobacteria bacterium]